MPIAAADLAIQTYSFRHFAPTEIPRLVRACGLRAVELCTMQIDLRQPARTEEVLAAYRAAGVDIVSFGVHGLGSPLDEAMCELAQRLGVRAIGVDFPTTLSLAPFRAAEKLAERFDLRFAIHNHGGYHWLGSRAMLTQVFADTSDRIGLCFDTAWAMHSGEDPIAMVRAFGKRLFGLHIKDFVFDRAAKERDIVIGEGNLDLAALRAALAEVGFAGWAALEYEGEPEDPSPAIIACVAAAHAQVCAAPGRAAQG